jgi:hypothetical protein
MEKNRVTSVEVDGAAYKRAGQVPDPDDRARVKRMVESVTISSADKTRKKLTGFPKTINTIFLSITILLLVIFVISTTLTVRSIFTETSAAGRVVDMTRRDAGNGSTYYYPVVEFPLKNGHLQTVELSEGSWPAAYQLGDQVTVRYDAENPLRARIQSFSSSISAWTLPIIMGVLSAAFVGAMFLVRWVLSSDDTQADEPAESS